MGCKILGVVFFMIVLAGFSSAVIINEFTVDPQLDWSGDNSTGSSDEWIELYNPSNQTIDLTNWTLVMNDTSSAVELLSATIAPESYFVILDPTGTMNNDGQIVLYDGFGVMVDSVSYGDFEDGNVLDNAPDGNAEDFSDECLSRIPNGEDTGIDSDDFAKIECTYGIENMVLPENEQGLNVEIAVIALQILPRWLEFGVLAPGSINNPALNGPITFDATGSTSDVNVEIMDVLGYPFDSGLKIDGGNPIGKIWTLFTSSKSDSAVPTLDIPGDAPSGNNQGTIVYLVTGPTP